MEILWPRKWITWRPKIPESLCKKVSHKTRKRIGERWHYRAPAEWPGMVPNPREGRLLDKLGILEWPIDQCRKMVHNSWAWLQRKG